MNNNNAPKNLDILIVMDDLFNFAAKESYLEKYSCELEYMVLEHILITAINRVAKTNHEEKRFVIKKLRNYIKAKYPNFYNDQVFKKLPIKRKVIAILNYYGYYNLSKTILSLNSVISNSKKSRKYHA